MFNIYAAMAQWERDVTVERTRAGIKTRKAKGLPHGRPQKFTPDKLKAIKRDLLARAGGDYKFGVWQVRKKHDISKQAMNHYFPGGRAVVEQQRRKKR